MQVLPESQTVHPAQLVPPHWAHLAAVQAEAVADAEEDVLVVGALEVVDAAEVVAVLEGTAEEEEEEEPPPDEPVKKVLSLQVEAT